MLNFSRSSRLRIIAAIFEPPHNPDYLPFMGKKWTTAKATYAPASISAVRPGKLLSARPSSLLDTRVVYRGDNLEQLAKLPDACVCYTCGDRIYIDPPFNSNRNYEVFWGETKEKKI